MRSAFRKSLNTLIDPDDRILIAVSGGVDSIVLAHLFIEEYKTRTSKENPLLFLVHCNFQLRGEDSLNDEIFVENFAKKHNLPIFIKRFDVETYKKEHQCSTQMAARNLRYDYFNELMDKHHISYTAVAHHADDQVETFFINLLRGAGSKGLRGMLAKHDRIIRPLLPFTRKEILNYADSQNLSYHEDYTNAETKYLRNQIRHELVPLLEKIDSHAKASILQSMDNLKAIEEKGLQEFEQLSALGFSPAQIRNIRQAKNHQSGKQFFSKTHRLVVNRGELIITELETNSKSIFHIENIQNPIEYPISLDFELIQDTTANLNLGPNVACLDYDKLQFPLTLRTWQDGDSFSPLGMSGKQKLSDFFINQKQSLIDKENTWLLCSGNDIVWIIGHRINHHFRYIKDTTKLILRVNFNNFDKNF